MQTAENSAPKGAGNVPAADHETDAGREGNLARPLESGLYVVATPIGNLGDMVPRAVDVLRAVDVIAAEDTRHSAGLLRHFSIETPMMAYHEHSDEAAHARIGKIITGGGAVALISDAGTPLISDPGFKLLRAAHAAGWRVVPVPGASAAIAALSVAGLPTDRFHFEGFLPAKAAARQARLEALAGEPHTLVFYEAPHRVLPTLEAMRDVFGEDRLGVLARELTKTFETVQQLPLGELAAAVAADSNQSRGEIVLVVAGAAEVETPLSGDVLALLDALAEAVPPRKAAALVASACGLRKKRLYDYLISR
ncbi:MAG: 16S rRNA (cytidine(1402)-2'-O)-methyltransferase [Halieaceae bacterium]|jgi:16S rRNA (cytidine1402-2'-O)-methyltransferase|nr:16S rRNA (cytidine(1402)-2'-O)-methyltransferase [Halieaceae bacterium]